MMVKYICILIIFFATNTFAGNTEGKVDYIQAGSGWTSDNVYFLVKVNAARNGKPACATDDRMAVNPATEAGKVMLSMLLAAKAASQTVELVGSNNCNIMGQEFESINYMRVK